jgi:hypothetical protein
VAGKLSVRCPHGEPTDGHHAIHRRDTLAQVPPTHPDLALQAVAFHGGADRAGHDQAKAGLSTNIPITHMHHQPSGPPATALTQHTAEFLG